MDVGVVVDQTASIACLDRNDSVDRLSTQKRIIHFRRANFAGHASRVAAVPLSFQRVLHFVDSYAPLSLGDNPPSNWLDTRSLVAPWLRRRFTVFRMAPVLCSDPNSRVA